MNGWRAGCVVMSLAMAGALGCKRKDTLPPVTFTPLDEGAEEPGVVDAPSWAPPGRAVLDNQALVYWQHEAGASGFNIRLLLPTVDGDGQPLSAAETLLVARTFEVRLTSGLKRIRARVRAEFAPGRLEIVLSGQAQGFARSMRLLAAALVDDPSDKALRRAQGRAMKEYSAPHQAEVAAVDVISRLLGRAPAWEIAGRAAIVDGERESSWRELTDPRRAVLVVHTGVSPQDSTAILGELSNKWTVPWGGQPALPDAVSRLRVSWPQPPAGNGHLRGEQVARLHMVEPNIAVGGGQPTLVLGRIIPTPTAAERAIARLGQRITQERVDARLEFSGGFALFLIRVPLLQRDVKKAVERALRDMNKSSERVHTRGRLQQATRLWLGARLVSASLHGEDRTALWSEALDLAASDAEIPRALAQEAAGMMAVTPEQLSEWMQRWMHPELGEGGWTWSVAGVDGAAREALAELGKLEPSVWASQ